MFDRMTRRTPARLLGPLCVAWAVTGTAAPDIGERAENALRGMSSTVQAAPMFSVQIDTRTTSTGEGGEKTSSITKAHMTVARPNLFRLELEAAGDRGVVVSNGDTLYSYFPSMEKYLAESAPARLADAGHSQGTIARSLAAAMGGIDLLAALLSENPYDELVENVIGIDYVDLDTVGGKKAHRLRFRQEEVDFDLWITEESPSAIVRVVPDLTRVLKRQAEAQPDRPRAEIQMEATLSRWSFANEVATDAFVFVPPPEATPIRREQAPVTSEGPSLKGTVAPDIRLPLLGGGEMHLAAHRGEDVVVLCFWASWGGRSEVLLSDLASLGQTYRDRGVLLYTVNQRESADAVQRFLEAGKVDVPVALDRDGKTGEAYRVTAIPQTVLVDRDGKVADVLVGVLPDTKDRIVRSLDRLLE